MVEPEFRYQKLIATLKKRGCRITSHRLALVRLLAYSEEHPNATQLYKKIRKQFPSISLATIYKTLALLKEEGEVMEINLRDENRYDGKKPYPHPHLICDRCDRIMDGDKVLPLQNLDTEIREKYGFQILRHQLVFFGLCQACQKTDPS
jgi:Fur family transcriptional regulator, peroxide stress response regulator